MDQETHEYSLVTWVVVLGVLLVVVVGISGYVILNPESIYRLFGGSIPVAQPVTLVNGPTTNTHRQPAHTKHYASIFFEFDYPDNFTVESELINATRTPSGEKVEIFGSAEVILSASGTDGVYTLRVTSTANADHTSVESAVNKAKQEFSARADRGANDSYQDITVVDRQAYKDYSSGSIHIGIPTSNLNYSAEIYWDPLHGERSTANSYLGVLEDSFTVK